LTIKNSAMRFMFIGVLVLSINFASGQTNQQQCVLELLNNEKDCVITSQIHGLPHGFMRYTTDASIGLSQKGINRIRDDWEQQKKTNYAMVWKPVVVYAGEDGLDGITSGPYYIKGEKDSVFRKGGYFLSVWERKSVNDSFRLVSDCGIRASQETSLDDGVVVMNEGASPNGKIGSFADFKTMATTSLLKAIQQHAIPKHELLLSNYGMFIGINDNNVDILNHGATLTIEKEVDNSSLHLVIGKISFATNPFPADKKLQKDGWYLQVWSKDKKQPGLLATLLKF
jgi:hypothetical protein